MKSRQFFSLLLSCLLILGCLTAPAGAVVTSETEAETAIMRATGRISESISGNALMILTEVSLDSGEVVTYNLGSRNNYNNDSKTS